MLHSNTPDKLFDYANISGLTVQRTLGDGVRMDDLYALVNKKKNLPLVMNGEAVGLVKATREHYPANFCFR